MARMIPFQQKPETFFVEEELFYQPSGEGSYAFVKIRKLNRSTFQAKRRISEQTGVPLKWIKHAGKKDSAATAVQWLSWPKAMERHEPTSVEDLIILETTLHGNSLGNGHVKRNHFRLVLTVPTAEFPDADRLATSFPNFYGTQRFGRERLKAATSPLALMTRSGNRESVSVFQGALFNHFLQQRLGRTGREPHPDDFWTNSNGKRFFQTEYDAETHQRYELGEITPTGPIFGYKTKLTETEHGFLKELCLEQENFRKWGKVAKGARRPLFITPELPEFEAVNEQQTTLSFALPAGAYATVYLMFLFDPQLATQPMSTWPDFTERVATGK